EAFAVYQRHLKTNGIIALNISNLSLDLEPVITSLGRQLGFATATIGQPVSNEPEGVLPSSWVVLSRDPHLMSALSVYASNRKPARLNKRSSASAMRSHATQTPPSR